MVDNVVKRRPSLGNDSGSSTSFISRIPSACFILLLIPRVLSALLTPIQDCDETFNYWEPLHFLLYKSGFQTWEYSPVYALRSYTYLILHGILAKIPVTILSPLFTEEKLAVFYALRLVLAVQSTILETFFVHQVIHTFGTRIGRYCLIFLACSPGMWHATSAFVPSATVLQGVLGFYVLWWQERTLLAILMGVSLVIFGWPYVAVLFVPFAIDVLFFSGRNITGVFKVLVAGLFMAVAAISIDVGVNFVYYNKTLLPAFNIISYNVLGGAGKDVSSSLYGTEPASFYWKNGILNFNIGFLLALFAPVFCILRRNFRVALYLSPMVIWMGIMWSQEHKEERFLFPVYPIFCLAAAYSVRALLDVFVSLLGRRKTKKQVYVGRSVVKFITFGTFITLSVSRIASLVLFYHAPLTVYTGLRQHLLENPSTTSRTVCVGKEWYRFPSHFFLPDTRLEFIKSGFHGLLPAHFENNTFEIPTAPMNNLNLEEPSRYVDLDKCDYVVDFVLPESKDEWITSSKWKRIVETEFLDAGESSSIFRAFYVPFASTKRTSMKPYVVYGREADA